MAITRHLFLLFTLLLFTGLSINTYAGPSCGDDEITGDETCEPPLSLCSSSGDNVGAEDEFCRAEVCTCCGDGIKDDDFEECDDGNTNPNDDCDTEGVNITGNGACTLTFCGDSTVQNPEQCDDGNAIKTDKCDTEGTNPDSIGVCTLTFCGDGTVQAPNGNDENEQCEPAGTETCDASCQNIEAETCTDGIKNQDETDVDCGGNTCDACADGGACLGDGDCTSNSCVDNVCTEPPADETCEDGIKNQDETDVDCGGNTCDACADGGACLGDGDCTSNSCVDNVCTEPPADETCEDGIKNQDETDVDCGGNTCDACADGGACLGDGDCTSNSCVDNVCTEPPADETCEDGIKNQDETDVDCGGSICDACVDGGACLGDGDCTSNSCVDNVCTEPPADETCEDGIKNQDETDVDCGGNTCDACADGGACLGDGDCTSNSCVDNVCTALGDNVIIDGCDTGVSDPGGIQAGIDQCEADASNHGLFVRCVAIFTKAEGVPQSDRKGIMKCAAHSSIDGSGSETPSEGGIVPGNARGTPPAASSSASSQASVAAIQNVVIDGRDTGVADSDGSIQASVDACAASAASHRKAHRKFVKCVGKVAKSLKRSGDITKREKKRMKKAAKKSSIGRS